MEECFEFWKIKEESSECMQFTLVFFRSHWKQEVWSSVPAKDSMNLLIQNMMDITDEDVFWSSRKELNAIANGLGRGIIHSK